MDAYDDLDRLDGRIEFALSIVKATAIGRALTPLVDRDIAETYVSLGNGLFHDRVARIVLGGLIHEYKAAA